MASGQTASRRVEEIALNEITLWVNAVFLYIVNDWVRMVARMTLRAQRVSGPVENIRYGYAVQYLDGRGSPMDLSKFIGHDDNITQICYQMLHIPTGLVSPVYDHEYSKVAPSTRGMPIDLGKVKMFPIAKVWPELAKEYSGNLPQLIQ